MKEQEELTHSGERASMSQVVIENPIINAPFDEPSPPCAKNGSVRNCL